MRPGEELDATKRLLKQIFAYRDLILLLAFRQVGRTFDRTVLGIFWMPLSYMLHVLSIGLVFQYVFGSNDPGYLLFFGINFAVWRTFTAAVGEGAVLWPNFGSYVKETNVPIQIYPIVWSIKLIFVLLIYMLSAQLFFIIWDGFLFKNILLGAVGLAVSMATVLQFGVVWSFVCLRYRDIASITPNLVLIAYLVTPVFWRAEMLGDRFFIALYNPIYHLLEIVRGPILNGTMPLLSLEVALGMLLFMTFLNLLIWRFASKRLVLWL